METQGRNICNALKAIRQQIADANGIDYSPEECHFKGECKGTCPKCEQDVRDLEYELHLRQKAGKAIKMAGIAAGLVAMTACSGGKVLDNSQIKGSKESPKVAVVKSDVDADSAANSKIFGAAEEMPSFPGGSLALMQYIREHLRYPKDSIGSTVTGRVLVGFVVNEDGSLSDVKVMKSLTPAMDEEAIRVVKSMPKWKPGKQNGKAVKIKYTVPVYIKPQ